MNVVIITKELHETGLDHPPGIVLDLLKTEDCIQALNKLDSAEIMIYGLTRVSSKDIGNVIPINDHVNCTGQNPLVGRQQKLAIDFIDMTTVYTQHENGVITHSCGKRLNTNFKYPSHYFCHISILARALGIKKIKGFLINQH